MPANTSEKQALRFERHKETKGAVRFKATAEDPVISDVYLRKPYGEDVGNAIIVTVEPAY